MHSLLCSFLVCLNWMLLGQDVSEIQAHEQFSSTTHFTFQRQPLRCYCSRQNRKYSLWSSSTVGFQPVGHWCKSRSKKLEPPQATQPTGSQIGSPVPVEAIESALPKGIPTSRWPWQLKTSLAAMMGQAGEPRDQSWVWFSCAWGLRHYIGSWPVLPVGRIWLLLKGHTMPLPQEWSGNSCMKTRLSLVNHMSRNKKQSWAPDTAERLWDNTNPGIWEDATQWRLTANSLLYLGPNSL